MATTINRSMTAAEWALLLALSVLWGGSFFFNSIGLPDLPPLSQATLRVVVAALLLAIE